MIFVSNYIQLIFNFLEYVRQCNCARAHESCRTPSMSMKVISVFTASENRSEAALIS